jgi:hypothetical protein
VATGSSPAAGGEPSILASDWYAQMIGAPLVPLGPALTEAYPAPVLRLAARRPALRGLLVLRLARRASGLALTAAEPGAATVLLGEAWLRRRRAVVLLEVIERRPQRPLRRRAYEAWRSLVIRPALRRALAGAQAMSERDERRLAAELGPRVVRRIDWARSTGAPATTDAGERRGVLSSGRAWCDWETLFAAAAGGDWPLTVVCAASDRERVEALNRDGRARVLSEIPPAEHDRLLAGAAVYAIALRDDAPSAGHVRLMAATDAGTAVVAGDVPALTGYLEDGITARLAPPGDPGAMRAAIEELLASPAERERLAAAARNRAREWTYAEYFASVGALIDESLSASSSPSTGSRSASKARPGRR